MDLGAIPKRRGTTSRSRQAEELVAKVEDVQMFDIETTTSIECLPDEVLEHILSLLSPYSDLENCALTCSRWAVCCRRVRGQHLQHFHQHLGKARLVWSHISHEGGVGTISKRYSHCAVYCPQRSSMFVFGGCTSTSSTFNDLWELNLSQRSWHRPISVGAYPSPKACASLVLHDDQLILFGGWTHPSLYPLHQSWKLFSELHIYNISENRWEFIEGGDRPPAMAGHSATVHQGSMVVFGGLHKQRSIGHYTSSNDVWTFDLTSKVWQLQTIVGEPPLPRYGQSQIVLSPNHLLVMGGCGGPNNEYADIWMLNMEAQPWNWVQMEVRGSEDRAKDIWSHPACRVGDKVVVLGKARKEEVAIAGGGSSGANLNVIPQARRGVNRGQGAMRRTSAPAPHHVSSSHQQRRQDISSSDSDFELAVEPMMPSRSLPSFRTSVSLNIGASPPSPRLPTDGLQGPSGSSRQGLPSATPPSALPPSNPASAPNALIPVKVTPAHAKSFGPSANTGTVDHLPGSTFSAPPGAAPGAPGNPDPGRQLGIGAKNRQKMFENRQRQLASLQKMEERLRTTPSSASSPRQPNTSSPMSSCPHHRLTMTSHLLDISQAVEGHWVEWLPLPHTSLPNSPQESILYTLVLGRTELIMFGGLQKDVSQGSSRPQPTAETVSNCLHFLNLPPITIS